MTHVLEDEFDDPGDTVDPNAVKRDRWDRPLLPPVNLALARAEGDERPFTRVTTFASALGDESNLAAWKMRLVAKGMAEREDLRALAKAADITDKASLNEVAQAAFEIAGGNVGRRLGTAFHKFSEMRDRGQEDDIDPEFLPHVEAYSAALKAHGIEIMPDYIERLCVWEKFSTSGSFDNIVMYRRKGEDVARPTILDKKGGADLSYGWLKIAVQLLCYASADAIWDQENYRWLPMPEGLRQDIALVAHVPTGKRGEDVVCDIYEVDLLPAVEAVRISYEARDWLKTRGLATKLKVDRTQLIADTIRSYEAEVLAEKEVADRAKIASKRRSPRKKAEPVVEVLEGAALDAAVAAAAKPIGESDDPLWIWPWRDPRLDDVTPEETAAAIDELGEAGLLTEGLAELKELLVEVTTTEDEIVADISLVSEDDDPFADLPVEIDLDHAVTSEEKYAALIRGAATPAELSTIRREAMEEEAWSDTLLKLGMERLADLKK